MALNSLWRRASRSKSKSSMYGMKAYSLFGDTQNPSVFKSRNPPAILPVRCYICAMTHNYPHAHILQNRNSRNTHEDM
jgi:hypothetical protein